ncbi:hypothetical protein C0J52_24266, partial [Blattella germanica]
QSELIADAVYGCGWYNASPRFKKAVHIIIIRCQRPVCFSVGGFAVISRETWLSVSKKQCHSANSHAYCIIEVFIPVTVLEVS